MQVRNGFTPFSWPRPLGFLRQYLAPALSSFFPLALADEGIHPHLQPQVLLSAKDSQTCTPIPDPHSQPPLPLVCPSLCLISPQHWPLKMKITQYHDTTSPSLPGRPSPATPVPGCLSVLVRLQSSPDLGFHPCCHLMVTNLSSLSQRGLPWPALPHLKQKWACLVPVPALLPPAALALICNWLSIGGGFAWCLSSWLDYGSPRSQVK